jgi:hypothetical protein
MPASVYIALIHHPVLNKEGKVVTTAVTNFDIHDLARTGTTYGVKKVFLITPVPAQQEMVRYIRNYWQEGYGATANPSRKQAVQCLEIADDIDQTCLTIREAEGIIPTLVATTAKKLDKSVGYKLFRERLKAPNPVLILFGTGYGMTPELLDRCDHLLDPIQGAGEFNHLPVRSAVAIILDRLLGQYD